MRKGKGHEELRNILRQSTCALCSWDLLTILKIIENHKELIQVGYICWYLLIKCFIKLLNVLETLNSIIISHVNITFF